MGGGGGSTRVFLKTAFPELQQRHETSPHPAVLVLVEELGGHSCGVSRFASHFISQLPPHRDVDELVPDALTVQDSDHLSLLGLHLQNRS